MNAGVIADEYRSSIRPNSISWRPLILVIKLSP
jgi:hypothetical protein